MNKVISILVLTCGIGLISISFTNCGKDKVKPTLKSELDKQLDAIIAANELAPLATPPAEDPSIVALGEMLFNERGMSGLNDVSCASCHEPSLGTGDGLPFSLGSGALGIFPNRKQFAGVSVPIRRHSPAIFNKGHQSAGATHALWDGRITVNNGVVTTPVADINGANPARSDITALMRNAFDLQPLFPIIAPDEFLGTNNPLANLGNPTVIWDTVLFNRLLVQGSYINAFAEAFPSVSTGDLSPGHIGRAIGAFVKTQFLANDTPFDRYLAGDIHAMTETQKRGMRVFYTTGACNVCHAGNRFTNEEFESIATPQLSFAPFQDDLGREHATNNPEDRYRFKVPNLRNLSLHPPYMHNGAFETLEAVVDHYSNVENSINNYVIPTNYQQHYDAVIEVDTDEDRNQERIDQISDDRLKAGLNLTPADRADLVEFLRDGLLDTKFQTR